MSKIITKKMVTLNKKLLWLKIIIFSLYSYQYLRLLKLSKNTLGKGANVYLASAELSAITAIEGKIPDKIHT